MTIWLDQVAYLIPWLLVVSLIGVVAGLMGRQQLAGKIVIAVGSALLIALVMVGTSTGLSWRLIPAVVGGYTYHPNTAPPDRNLVTQRPEVVIERQLDLLIGQTGSSPLHPNAALSDYEVETVHISRWARPWLLAELDVRFMYEDGSHATHTITLEARGGSYIHLPLIGEVNRNAGFWYAPESSIARFLTNPAPSTTLSEGPAPIRLVQDSAINTDTANLAVDPETSFAVTGDITAGGRALVDVDQREGGEAVGNALLSADAINLDILAETWIVGRPVASPNGERIAYVDSNQQTAALSLIVVEENGDRHDLGRVDGLTHHWVGNDQIATRHGGYAILIDAETGARTRLVKLPSSQLTIGQFFQVAPDGRHIAYVDVEGRLWVESLEDGDRYAAGWDVVEMGWGPGMAWSPDSSQLVYTSSNRVLPHNQVAIWLWDETTHASTLIGQWGNFSMPDQGVSYNDLRIGTPCWLDKSRVLAAVHIYPGPGTEQIRLIVSNINGGGLWDVTPENITSWAHELHCEPGWVAATTDRVAISLYQVIDQP